jgi:hypothetical protein
MLQLSVHTVCKYVCIHKMLSFTNKVKYDTTTKYVQVWCHCYHNIFFLILATVETFNCGIYLSSHKCRLTWCLSDCKQNLFGYKFSALSVNKNPMYSCQEHKNEDIPALKYCLWPNSPDVLHTLIVWDGGKISILFDKLQNWHSVQVI